MSIGRALRRAAKSLVFSGRANPFALRRSLDRMVAADEVAILNFHRVGPRDGSSYLPLDPALFDDILSFCRQRGEVRTFADLGQPRTGTRPIFVISFDDGYRDFLEHSLPALRRHGLRCNHNFIPGCIESGLPPLNVLLQDFIGKAPQSLLGEAVLEGFGPLGSTDRERTGLRASAYLKALPLARQRALMASLQPVIDRDAGFAPTPMMTLQELRAVAGEVEVGAHSFDHATLSAEQDDYVRDDARRCRAWFAERLGTPTSIYALPNGAATARQRDILREEGYDIVLRVEEASSPRTRSEHRRFTIYGDSAAEIRSRSLGLAA